MNIFLAGCTQESILADIYQCVHAPREAIDTTGKTTLYTRTLETFQRQCGRTRFPLMGLESFYYAEKSKGKQTAISLYDDIIMDSGAFTFMAGADASRIAWEEYIERYAAFLRKFRIEKYLELDIDAIVGYPRVLELRRMLERLVGRPCIPVWHKGRGLDDYLRMCDAYPYVAIGGIVVGEIRRSEYRFFPQFIHEAHARGAKVHGLGFTSLQNLPRYHFDSVDSTSWLVGMRVGYVDIFNGQTIVKTERREGERLCDMTATRLFCYTEWMKFQNYARTHF